MKSVHLFDLNILKDYYFALSLNFKKNKHSLWAIYEKGPGVTRVMTFTNYHVQISCASIW